MYFFKEIEVLLGGVLKKKILVFLVSFKDFGDEKYSCFFVF